MREYAKLSIDMRPDLMIVDCASCSRHLATPNQRLIPGDPEVMEGRVHGRPFCWRCIGAARMRPLPSGFNRADGLT
jgi:hypothetical protein